ncbi:MAG: hypothetical protein IH591_13160, partial [Bacteroidales bacterium]|nr:hypothetical protein [Bacteroidales bacterium]
MGQSNSLSGKSKQLQVILFVTLALLTVSFLWIFYDFYAYLEIKSVSDEIDMISNFIGIGFAVRIFLYISFGIFVLKAFRNGLKPGILVIISILTGVVSAICLLFDFAALKDIGTDYLVHGYDCTMEWIWLFGSLAVRLLFFMTVYILIIRILRNIRLLASTGKTIVDEIVYEVTQYVGIVCGLIGVIFTSYAYIALNDFTIRDWLVWLLMSYCIVIFLPYFTIIIYWIIRLAGRREMTLFDEKIRHDIAHSGLTAWLVSIAVMV